MHTCSIIHGERSPCACGLPYSGIFSLGANFRDFRGQTSFRENKNHEKSIKIDVIMCVCRYKLVHDAWMRWFSTVSLPSFGFCREESLCQYTKCQQTCRDASKLSKSTLAVLFPSVIFHPRWQSWYFRKSKALHTKGRLGHCFTSLLLLFVIQCRFFGSLMGRGHQLVVPHSIAQGIQFTQLPFGANSCPCQLLHEAN